MNSNRSKQQQENFYFYFFKKFERNNVENFNSPIKYALKMVVLRIIKFSYFKSNRVA